MCSLCCQETCLIEMHIHRPRHFKHLWRKIEEAQKAEETTGTHAIHNAQFYHDWPIETKVGTKTIRLNHIDLSVYMCSGKPQQGVPQVVQPIPKPIPQQIQFSLVIDTGCNTFHGPAECSIVLDDNPWPFEAPTEGITPRTPPPAKAPCLPPPRAAPPKPISHLSLIHI